MTDTEMRQQRGMLLVDLEEAQKRLAALQEKAIRVGRAFQEFGRLLEREAATKIYIAGQRNYNLPIEFLDEQKYKAALSFADALQLADDLRSAIASERDLADRLRRHP